MSLNPTKTKSMLLTMRQKHQNTCSYLTLLVKSELIEQVSEHRLLGVIIDNKLTWKQHIELLCKGLAKNIYLMSRLKKYSNSLALKLFFYGHIMSHIDYASIVWDGSSENNLKPLYSLYKRAIKLIVPNPTLNLNEKLASMNLLPLKSKLMFNKCLQMHKSLFDKAPMYLMTTVRNALSGRSNGSRNYIMLLPKPRIDLFKYSLYIQV